MDDLKSLVTQISEETKINEKDILEKIKAKRKELSDLVSEIGAAHIIANEMGVELASKPMEESRFKIHDLMEGMSAVDLFARVQAVYEPRIFKRKDGEESQVASVELTDETGGTRLVLWGDKADLIKKLEKGMNIKVQAGYVREGMRGLEVHLGNRGKLILNPEDAPEIPKVEKRVVKINELESDMQSVDLAVRLVQLFPTRTFTRKDGSDGKVTSAILGDETGTVRASLWGDKADIHSKVNPGDVVLIENAYTKEGLQGVDLQLGWRARIVPNPEGYEVPQLNEFRNVAVRTHIKSLQAGDSYKEIRGALVDIYGNNILYAFCQNCNKRLSQEEGKWICPECGEAKPDFSLILSGTLDDGSGAIRTVFYRDQAERLLGFSAKEAVKLAKEDELRPVEKAREFLGKEIIVSGNVKMNDYSGTLELVAREIRDVNPVEESGAIMKELEVLS